MKFAEGLAVFLIIMFMWMIYLYMTDSSWSTPVLFFSALAVFTYGYMKHENWCETTQPEKEESRKE